MPSAANPKKNLKRSPQRHPSEAGNENEDVAMLKRLQECHDYFRAMITREESNQKYIAANEYIRDLEARLKETYEDQKKYNSHITQLEKESDTLLIRLHETQEALESYLTIESQLQLQHHRNERFALRHPLYWDFESFNARDLQSKDGAQVIEWQFFDVKFGSEYVSNLRFKTFLKKGMAGIVICRNTDDDGPLLRWPNAYAGRNELPLLVHGEFSNSTNSLFSMIGPSDLSAIICLIKNLANLLDIEYPKLQGWVNKGLREGLITYGDKLTALPSTLRYDSIHLNGSFKFGDYTAIEITIKNLNLGRAAWPQFTYRLASVSEPGQGFGQHPRLEFAPDAATVLQTWFAESNDERGARLELRFAHPSAFDTNVWNVLNGHDQVFIAALIGSMRMQISDLLKLNDSGAESWESWQNLADSLRHIMGKQLTSSST